MLVDLFSLQLSMTGDNPWSSSYAVYLLPLLKLAPVYLCASQKSYISFSLDKDSFKWLFTLKEVFKDSKSEPDFNSVIFL